MEATVSEVGDSGVTVNFLGLEETQKVAMKELLPSMGRSAREKQIGAIQKAVSDSGPGGDGPLVGVNHNNPEGLPKPAPGSVKVGDFCRAIYSEDAVEYEATVLQIEESDGHKYCLVEFVGYGNQENIWIDDIIPSMGEDARKAQIAASGSTMQEEATKFEVGDFCRAVYPEDEVEYEGKVTSIDQDEDGNSFCTVEFLGYGNEETVWVADLKPSNGEDSRKEQLSLSVKTESDSLKTEETESWKVGDFCRCVYSEDGNEYEAEIQSANEHEGSTYYIVKFVGYGNEESVWCDGMKPSEGQEARDKQVKESGTEQSGKEWKVGDFCRAICADDSKEYEAEIKGIEVEDCGNKSAVVVFVGKQNEEVVWLESLTDSHGPEARQTADKLTEPPREDTAKVDETVACEQRPEEVPVEPKQEQRVKAKWSVGDFCQVVYNGEKKASAVGKAVEGVICSISESSARVRILGLYEEFQTAPLADLKRTAGPDEREEQILSFQNEEVTPSKPTSKDINYNYLSPTMPPTPAPSPIVGDLSLDTVKELVDRLSEELSLKSGLEESQGLVLRLQEENVRLQKENMSLFQQVDCLRTGNAKLYQENKSLKTRQTLDDSTVSSLEYSGVEKDKYAVLERKYAAQLESSAADERVLLARISELKRENSDLKQKLPQ